MAQTASGLANVLKDAWTRNDRLAKQFYDENPPLARFEQVQATMIGQQAQVPIHAGRSGGYTSTGAAGGSLNPSDKQRVDQAAYTLVYHWFQVELETSALNQASGSNLQSVIAAKDLEIEGAVNDMRKQATRQLVTNGDSIVAQPATSGGSSTTVKLVASPSGSYYGYDALVRGWLYPGMPVDIGTTADTDALSAGNVITAFDDTSTAPTITVTSAVDATKDTHFIYWANPNSTTAANPEMNGLRNLVNTTGAVGGVNPSTAGQEFWKAAKRDTSTTALSLDLLLDLQRAATQKSGAKFSDLWFGLKQQANFYALLQNQVRFQGEGQIGAGAVDAPTWNGLKPQAFNDILDSDVFVLNLPDFVRITGSITKPTWASDLEGAGGQLRWKQGNTAFTDGVVFPVQAGIQRRNTHAAATALTA